jgi:predicted DNA-binding antitoxin AbrB/MazE fold protein
VTCGSLRLRYENGHFVPLDDVPELEEGEEIEVEWEPLTTAEAVSEALDWSRGIWADLEGIEEFFAGARTQWNETWQQRLGSL